MTPSILYQDNQLLVISKPAGWVTNDSDSARALQTMQKWLAETGDFELARNTEFRSGIVHRLDKDTSGVMLVAKTPKAFEYLQRQFKERKVQKKYLALVHGIPLQLEGDIDQPILRNPGNRRKFGVFPGGRESQTKYQVVSTYHKGVGTFALVACFPKTGRTHQIRVHMRHLGHSIVGDHVYAERKLARKDRDLTSRIFLHAASISFEHPQSGKRVFYEAPLPDELQEILDKLT